MSRCTFQRRGPFAATGASASATSADSSASHELNTPSSSKDGAAAERPSGTRPSAHASQLLCSFGMSELDAIMGGGNALGSLMLMEEDASAHMLDTLGSFYVAEGLVSGQTVVVIDSRPIDDDTFFHSLPSLVEDESGHLGLTSKTFAQAPSPVAPPELKIAWRYNPALASMGAGAPATLPMPSESPGAKISAGRPLSRPLQQQPFCHSLTSATPISTKILEASRQRCHRICILDYVNEEENSCGGGAGTLKLCQNIITRLVEILNRHTSESKEKPRVLRLWISDFGNPFWGDPGSSTVTDVLCQFMFHLRSLIRRYRFVTGLVCAPQVRLGSDQTFAVRLRHLSDATLRFYSWLNATVKATDYERNEFSGLLELVKPLRLNTLTPFNNGVTLFCYKIHSNGKLSIHRRTLPPDESDPSSSTSTVVATTAGGTTSTFASKPTLSCSSSHSTKPSVLDF